MKNIRRAFHEMLDDLIVTCRLGATPEKIHEYAERFSGTEHLLPEFLSILTEQPFPTGRFAFAEYGLIPATLFVSYMGNFNALELAKNGMAELLNAFGWKNEAVSEGAGIGTFSANFFMWQMLLRDVILRDLLSTGLTSSDESLSEKSISTLMRTILPLFFAVCFSISNVIQTAQNEQIRSAWTEIMVDVASVLGNSILGRYGAVGLFDTLRGNKNPRQALQAEAEKWRETIKAMPDGELCTLYDSNKTMIDRHLDGMKQYQPVVFDDSAAQVTLAGDITDNVA